MNRKLAIGIALLLAVAVGAFFLFRDQDEATPATELSSEERTFESNDWMDRACALPKEQLVRIQRGHHPVHSKVGDSNGPGLNACFTFACPRFP